MCEKESSLSAPVRSAIAGHSPLEGYEPKRLVIICGNMTSSPWTEEQRQQFLEQQTLDVSRPVDLERYDVANRAQERSDRNEALESGEPPYAELGTTMQVDGETRQLLSEGSLEGDTASRGRTERAEAQSPQLARVEARVDVSPGRRSIGYESIQSHPSLGLEIAIEG